MLKYNLLIFLSPWCLVCRDQISITQPNIRICTFKVCSNCSETIPLFQCRLSTYPLSTCPLFRWDALFSSFVFVLDVRCTQAILCQASGSLVILKQTQAFWTKNDRIFEVRLVSFRLIPLTSHDWNVDCPPPPLESIIESNPENQQLQCPAIDSKGLAHRLPSPYPKGGRQKQILPL